MSDVPNEKPIPPPPEIAENIDALAEIKFLPPSAMAYTRIWFRRLTLFSSTAMSAVSNQGIGTTKPPKDSAGSWLTIIVCKSLRT